MEGYNIPKPPKAEGYQIGELVEQGQFGKTYKVLKELTQVTFYICSIFILLYLFPYMVIYCIPICQNSLINSNFWDKYHFSHVYVDHMIY